jgi:superfamily II DNA helicase RecQ
VNNTIFEEVKDILCITNPATIVRTPDRPNIFLEVIHCKVYEIEDIFFPFAQQIHATFKKTIIFAETIKTVSKIYDVMRDAVGPQGKQTISMFHSEIGDGLRKHILTVFPSPDSPIRVLVSTVAFGMGVEIRDIRHVIHWGKCTSMLQFW